MKQEIWAAHTKSLIPNYPEKSNNENDKVIKT